MPVYLEVVGVGMGTETTVLYNFDYVSRVEDEEDGAQYRPLGDAESDCSDLRDHATEANVLRATGQVGSNPCQRMVRDAK